MSPEEKLALFMTENAHKTYLFLCSKGVNAALALAMLEVFIPESDLWDLPERTPHVTAIREDLSTR